jgi:Flp pilus assembly protein TadG
MVETMSTWTLIGKLQRAWRRFGSAEGGNVVITFALATIPMVGLVGAAVDYSHANSIKAAMQAALDATALAMSKTAGTLNATDLQTKSDAYFKALFTRPEAASVTITASYNTTTGSSLTVAGSAMMTTNFMKVMGFQQLNITGTSTASWGNNRLRVALVLDNTGSMADSGKITALRTATKNLLTTLQNAAANAGDVYVSIVPFVKDINVDPVNYNATWIDWTDWDANNGSCSKGWGVNTKSDCLSQNGNPKWTPDNHNTWNGCVTDRGNSNAPSSGNYDANVATPTATITASLFPAEQYNPCPQGIMPLNYNWSAMSTLVGNMSPGGNTNQAIGLALGWMSLVGGGPFPAPPAMDPKYQYSQVIILLTDGLNTQDRWYTSQTSIDNRQAITCTDIKASGITLYTVQVNTGGDPTSTLLQTCASDPSKFFLLTSSNQILTTFNQIGTALSQLRIAK